MRYQTWWNYGGPLEWTWEQYLASNPNLRPVYYDVNLDIEIFNSSATQPLQELQFPQMAVGGGYATIFTLVNTGTSAAAADLWLADKDGFPLMAELTAGTGAPSVGSSYRFDIPPGGMRTLRAGAVPGNGELAVGWARATTAGGLLGGVATYQIGDPGSLSATVGVLGTSVTSAATIPVDDESPAAPLGRATGYAVANPGTGNIDISLVLVGTDGTVVNSIRPPQLNPLRAGGHVSRFVWEDLGDANLRFRGSVVLVADPGGEFAAVALMLNKGKYSAVPVIPSKAAQVRF
jgi:hypothetical protein